ncbi:hypothetical protein F4823DRAFT_562963 [Ustulina deusta]|nr:hypothetical protein F4823DRAFT_562963 [Ustulina deusta]
MLYKALLLGLLGLLTTSYAIPLGNTGRSQLATTGEAVSGRAEQVETLARTLAVGEGAEKWERGDPAIAAHARVVAAADEK